MNLTAITKGQKTFLAVYAVLILAIYTTVTTLFGGMLSSSKTTAETNHANRMNPAVTEVTYPDGTYTEVKVGVYIESLRNISIADSSFEGVFYLWFAWQGDEALSPGDHFQIVGGSIDNKEKVSEHFNNGSNYQRYKVDATFDKIYDTTRVSLENHMLNIYIEDNQRDGAKLRYVADTEQTGMSSRVKVPGFTVDHTVLQAVKPHEYKSSYSSPSAPNGEHRIFSQYVVGININRENIGFFLKILIPYLLSIGLGLSTLWSRPSDTDSRFGLAGAAFFGVVANAYIVSSVVPSNGGNFGLLDVLTTVSLMTVFLIVATSITSLNLYDKQGKTALALLFDKVAFVCIAIGIITFNLVMPFCAYLR